MKTDKQNLLHMKHLLQAWNTLYLMFCVNLSKTYLRKIIFERNMSERHISSMVFNFWNLELKYGEIYWGFSSTFLVKYDIYISD